MSFWTRLRAALFFLLLLFDNGNRSKLQIDAASTPFSISDLVKQLDSLLNVVTGVSFAQGIEDGSVKVETILNLLFGPLATFEPKEVTDSWTVLSGLVNASVSYSQGTGFWNKSVVNDGLRALSSMSFNDPGIADALKIDQWTKLEEALQRYDTIVKLQLDSTLKYLQDIIKDSSNKDPDEFVRAKFSLQDIINSKDSFDGLVASFPSVYGSVLVSHVEKLLSLNIETVMRSVEKLVSEVKATEETKKNLKQLLSNLTVVATSKFLAKSQVLQKSLFREHAFHIDIPDSVKLVANSFIESAAETKLADFIRPAESLLKMFNSAVELRSTMKLQPGFSKAASILPTKLRSASETVHQMFPTSSEIDACVRKLNLDVKYNDVSLRTLRIHLEKFDAGKTKFLANNISLYDNLEQSKACIDFSKKESLKKFEKWNEVLNETVIFKNSLEAILDDDIKSFAHHAGAKSAIEKTNVWLKESRIGEAKTCLGAKDLTMSQSNSRSEDISTELVQLLRSTDLQPVEEGVEELGDWIQKYNVLKSDMNSLIKNKRKRRRIPRAVRERKLPDAFSTLSSLIGGIGVIKDLAAAHASLNSIENILNRAKDIDTEISIIVNKDEEIAAKDVWNPTVQEQLKNYTEDVKTFFSSLGSPKTLDDFKKIFVDAQKIRFPDIDTVALRDRLPSDVPLQSDLNTLTQVNLELKHANGQLTQSVKTLDPLRTFLDRFHKDVPAAVVTKPPSTQVVTTLYSSIPTTTTAKSAIPIGVIAGSVGGAVVLIVCAAMLIWWFRCRGKKKKESKKDAGNKSASGKPGKQEIQKDGSKPDGKVENTKEEKKKAPVKKSEVKKEGSKQKAPTESKHKNRSGILSFFCCNRKEKEKVEEKPKVDEIKNDEQIKKANEELTKRHTEYLQKKKIENANDTASWRFIKKGCIFIPREIDDSMFQGEPEPEVLHLKGVQYNWTENVMIDIGSDRDEVELEPSSRASRMDSVGTDVVVEASKRPKGRSPAGRDLSEAEVQQEQFAQVAHHFGVQPTDYTVYGLPLYKFQEINAYLLVEEFL